MRQMVATDGGSGSFFARGKRMVCGPAPLCGESVGVRRWQGSLSQAGTAGRCGVFLTESQLSALLMSPIKTIDLLYGCPAHSVMPMKNGKANGAADAVLYGADGSREPAAMA